MDDHYPALIKNVSQCKGYLTRHILPKSQKLTIKVTNSDCTVLVLTNRCLKIESLKKGSWTGV